MKTDITGFCLSLLDALEEFDQRTPKLGLYACEELLSAGRPPQRHPEWSLCLKPHLERLGCRIGWERLREGSIHFYLPGGTGADLQLLRTSKVKVRKFGSHYRVDPQNKYEERWNALAVDKHLRQLWKPAHSVWGSDKLHVLLFIGFDKSAAPFEKEFAELQARAPWERYGVAYVTRSWEDRYERHFHVRLSAWARGREVIAPSEDAAR